METTGPRDRLVWEEMGKDCKGKVRYWLLSCYICVRRCEWSMLQLDSLWCSSKGCRRYYNLCLSSYKVKNTHAYMPLIARKSDVGMRWACNSCVLFLPVPTAGPTAPGQGCEVVLSGVCTAGAETISSELPRSLLPSPPQCAVPLYL